MMGLDSIESILSESGISFLSGKLYRVSSMLVLKNFDKLPYK